MSKTLQTLLEPSINFFYRKYKKRIDKIEIILYGTRHKPLILVEKQSYNKKVLKYEYKKNTTKK